MAEQPPSPVVHVRPGDIVLARGGGVPGVQFHAVVTGARLGRLVVERCDGRPAGPLALRDVVQVYKAVGAPGPSTVDPAERRRPTAQLKLEL